MTEIILSEFQPQLADADAYDAVNNLSLDYYGFSSLSNLYSRAYGVLDGDIGGLKDQNSQQLVSYILNDCARNSLHRDLFTTQSHTEKILGFNLTSHFHYEEIPIRGDSSMQLQWPGIEKLETTRNWYSVIDSVAVDPFILRTVPVVEDDDVDQTKRIVWADKTVFKNPMDVIARRDDDKNRILLTNKLNPRYGKTVSGHLEIPIDDKKTQVGDENVNLQHRKHIRVVFDAPDISALPAGGTLFPVYSGTNQKIPTLNGLETLSSGKNAFTIPEYALVSKDFRFETLDWQKGVNGNFFQWLPEISVKYQVEEDFFVEFVWAEGDEETVYQFDPLVSEPPEQPRLKIIVINSQQSIIQLYLNDALFCDVSQVNWVWSRCFPGLKRKKMPDSFRIRLRYKTNPNNLKSIYAQQIPNVRRAIAAKVAAELPTEDCGCKAEIGYVWQQQKSYFDQFIGAFGTEVRRFKFGELHGQVFYETIIDNAVKYARPIVKLLGKVI